MAYFQLGEQQLHLRVGAQRVGPESDADIQLPGVQPAAGAIVEVGSEHAVIIRRATADAVIRVNGVLLGAQPTPLMHGDRVEIGGLNLRFGDAKQEGSTQFVSSSAVADALRARGSVPAKPTVATGGRLISLVDGREYTVPLAGLTIGRDPAADVVVPANEVSRRHVEIAPVSSGYLLTDLSTNGVWVNGTRIEQQQVLGRGDIIKVGAEEFRFYADVAKPPTAAPSEALRPTVPTTQPPPAPAAVEAPPAVPPTPQTSDPRPPTPSAAPAAAAPRPPTPSAAPTSDAPSPGQSARPSRPALAVLEIANEGPQKGMRLEVHSPLTNIGRGDHNDLVIANESVSVSHAKLQKRDDGWFIVDIDSTNGTYVGGRRVKGEQALAGAPDLRFGDVKVTFQVMATPAEPESSTRAIAGVTVEEARRQAARKSAMATPARVAIPVQREKPAANRTSAIVWIILVLGAAAIAVWWFVFRGS